MGNVDMVGGEITVSTPNSLILIDGGRHSAIPETMGGDVMAATSSCVAIGTTPDVDGPTTIRLRPASDSVALPVELFRGHIETPQGVVYVRSSHDEVYLALIVEAPWARLVVNVDDPVEPTQIDIQATGDSG